MPQAKIQINGTDGSNDNLPINTLVQLSNHNVGGEVSYAWAIAYQPPGATDALSSTIITNPTFTPKKEGTYRISLVVNQSLQTQVSDTAVVGIRQLKSGLRVPAAQEEVEVDPSTGWSEGAALNPALRALDDAYAYSIVTAHNFDAAVGIGKIVSLYFRSTIKAGLPGEEYLIGAHIASNGDSPLYRRVRHGIVLGSVDGSPILAGSTIKVLIRGMYQPTIAGVLVLSGTIQAGDVVYVTGSGTLCCDGQGAGSAGRPIGYVGEVISQGGGVATIRLVIDAPPLPFSQLTLYREAALPDNAAFGGVVLPQPMHFRQFENVTGYVQTLPSADVTFAIKNNGTTIATGSINHTTGAVTITPSAPPNDVLAGNKLTLATTSLGNGAAGFTLIVMED